MMLLVFDFFVLIIEFFLLIRKFFLVVNLLEAAKTGHSETWPEARDEHE